MEKYWNYVKGMVQVKLILIFVQLASIIGVN
jgi:hypothetical protein